MAEEETTVITTLPADDLAGRWDRLDSGTKAKAMRTVHEDQQKKVIELQRMRMEKEVEYAEALVRARGAEELQQNELKEQLVKEQLEPIVEEIRALSRQIQDSNDMLNAFERIGKGII